MSGGLSLGYVLARLGSITPAKGEWRLRWNAEENTFPYGKDIFEQIVQGDDSDILRELRPIAWAAGLTREETAGLTVRQLATRLKGTRIVLEAPDDYTSVYYRTIAFAREKSAQKADSEETPSTTSGPEEVFDQWAEEGPLVHEPTNLACDDYTGGGPVYGSRWYFVGPPDASKTAVIVQIADTYAKRGVTVGILAVDEEPSDLQTRLLQRRGFTRQECEARDPAVIEKMRAALAGLPIHYYGAEWTIEAAASDLAERAGGGKAALFVDSVQTTTCEAVKTIEAKDREVTERMLVTANVRAIRAVATKHRMIVIATSEMNRAAYRTIEQADQSRRAGDIAAGKESGAIEYSGRVILSIRSVEDTSDEYEVFVAKNKHGPRGERFHLVLDRVRMVLKHGSVPSATERADRRNARALEANLGHAARLAVVLAENPGVMKNDLFARSRAKYGSFGEPLVKVALVTLGGAVRVEPRPNRGRAHFIDGRCVAKNILALVTVAAERRCLLDARWPSGIGGPEPSGFDGPNGSADG